MKLINYLKALAYFFIIFIILIFLISILYYFDILNNNVIKYLKCLVIILSSFISGIKIGKLSNQKGYLKGIILSLVIIFIFFIISIITNSFKYSLIIYYILIIIITTLGSMIGKLKSN